MQLVDSVQHPADRAVPSAAQHTEVGDVLEELQTQSRSAPSEIVHLTRIEQILEFPEYSGALFPAGLAIDEDQQRVGAHEGSHLKRSRHPVLRLGTVIART